MIIIKLNDRLAALERRLGGANAGLERRLAEARAALVAEVDRLAGALGIKPATDPELVARQLDRALEQVVEARRRASSP